jgi:hypothetical protein
MSEKTAHLLEEFQSLPADEKEVFTVELLARAEAQGLPVPRYVGRLRQRNAENANRGLSPTERIRILREWAQSHPITPLLSDEAISRESIYGTRG